MAKRLLTAPGHTRMSRTTTFVSSPARPCGSFFCVQPCSSFPAPPHKLLREMGGGGKDANLFTAGAQGVCLGLLWGILSVARWPSPTAGARCLQAPYLVCEYLWIRWGWPAPAQLPYVTAILLSTGLVYLVTYVIHQWWQRAGRQRRRAALLRKRRTRRDSPWSGR